MHQPPADRTPSPLADIRSFEFGSTLPPGALDPSIPSHSYSSSSASLHPHQSSASSSSSPMHGPPPGAGDPHMGAPPYRSHSGRMKSSGPPSSSPPIPSPSGYFPSQPPQVPPKTGHSSYEQHMHHHKPAASVPTQSLSTAPPQPRSSYDRARSPSVNLPKDNNYQGYTARAQSYDHHQQHIPSGSASAYDSHSLPPVYDTRPSFDNPSLHTNAPATYDSPMTMQTPVHGRLPQQPERLMSAHDSRGGGASLAGGRALPALPPPGAALGGLNQPSSPLPASPTTPQRRRALPTPPVVPPRPPHSYSEHGSSNIPPNMTPSPVALTPANAPPASAPRPTPAYEPPAPGSLPNAPPSAAQHAMQDQQPDVQRSYTSSTQHTTATGESFFANQTTPSLTPNTSLSSQHSYRKDMLDHRHPSPDYRESSPMEQVSAPPNEPAQKPQPPQQNRYQPPLPPPQPQQYDYRPERDEPPHVSVPQRPFVSAAYPSGSGDRTPSASNGYLPHFDGSNSGQSGAPDRDQLDVFDTRSRTVSASSFDGFPSTPRAGPTRPLQRGDTVDSEPPTQLMLDHHIHDDTPVGMQAGSSSHPGAPDTEWAEQSNSRWVQTKLLLHQSQEQDGYYEEDGVYDEYEDSASEDHDIEEEVNEIRFFNPAFLSETAVQLRDRVVRGHHVKGGITWVGTFTGRDLVTTIQSFLPSFTREDPQDRRFALITARSLQSQLWVMEVDWDDKPIRDSSDVVFNFMNEMEGGTGPIAVPLPSGVLTMATKCYSPSCPGDKRCYAPRCPWKTPPSAFLTNVEEDSASSRAPMVKNETDWTEDVDPVILAELTEQQRTRQTLIRQAILEEERYEADLGALESVFITPLLSAHPPVIEPYHRLEHFVQQLFGNVTEIRRASRRLIDNFAIRLREQSPLIVTVGDILLEAATDFRSLYPEYMDNLSHADQLLTTTVEENSRFAAWLQRVSHNGDRRGDLRYLLKRPATHLQRYPPALEQILKATSADDPDYDFLNESLSSIQNISYIAQLKLFQASKGRGPNSDLAYESIVPASVLSVMEKKELKRQMVIWELIKGEMDYVADLEAIDTVFVEPLRNADNPIVDRSRLDIFIDDAFHNYRSLIEVHSRLLEALQERQIEQHPHFGMISDIVLDAALNWHEAYLEYMPHYPIAKAKILEEKMRNPAFAAFLQECRRNPISKRQDIDHYISRPIPRLVRYPLLLKEILKLQKAVGPPDHPDIECIPQIIDLIDNLAKAGQKGVAVNTAKVELWQFKTTLDGGKFGKRAVKDLDLLNPMRELIHKGKVYRQPEGTISGAWSELHLLLFDNYFVLVKVIKSKVKDAPLRYTINRRPIPLELFKLGTFTEPAQNRSLGLLKTIRGAGGGGGGNQEEATTVSDSRTVYPFTYSFIGQGQLSGQYTLWTDSAAARSEWEEKLRHAKVLRDEVNDAGKVFEMTPLSLDTFYQAPGYGVPANTDDYTGRVTCSVPFMTPDRRSLVAVGCEQGVWIGVRHAPSSLRKVLHVRSVTQIAVLEEFGIFLVLADKSLLAYHLEALVPTAASPQVRSAPQRLSGVRDIVFFCVGQISGRTLVLYMKRKGLDSVFRVLEPILNREPQDNRQRRGFGSLLSTRSEWFRVYKDFFIPTEAVHVHFLKAKLAIVCAKGFEIMDLTDLKGGAIPIFDPVKVREKPMLAELARQCENAKPLAMFRSTDSEFLLCYDTFGIYVDRHGEPNRTIQAIEWEGQPESVAFHPPYLLLISPSFIEIRHIDSAKLLQIYTGSDIRCTWDGTGGQARQYNDSPGPKGWGDEVTSQEPRIHICKRTDDSRRTRGIGQHIYELTPTLLLNNPLLNPVYTQDPNYFPPAPLNHRTSMGGGSIHDYGGYGGYSGYDGGNYPVAADRASISSASTHNFGGAGAGANGGGGGGGGGGAPVYNQFAHMQQQNHSAVFPTPQTSGHYPQDMMPGGNVYRQGSRNSNHYNAPPYGGNPGNHGNHGNHGNQYGGYQNNNYI